LDNVRAGIHRSNGSYGWNGAFGTHFWVDFEENLVGLLMLQVSGSTQIWQIQEDYDNAVWQAIVD
jgi:CubicO group peptidase (beta-lactamase class C family)